MNKLKALEYFIASLRGRAASPGAAAGRQRARSAEDGRRAGSAVGSRFSGAAPAGVRPTAGGSSASTVAGRCWPSWRSSARSARCCGDRPKRRGYRWRWPLPSAAGAPLLLPALPPFMRCTPRWTSFRTVSRLGVMTMTADVLLLHGWPRCPGLRAPPAGRHAQPDHGLARRTGPSTACPGTPSRLARSPTCRCATRRASCWTCGSSAAAAGRCRCRCTAGSPAMRAGGAGSRDTRPRRRPFAELTTRDPVQSGRLVPVLLDWEVRAARRSTLLYKGSAPDPCGCACSSTSRCSCLRQARPRRGTGAKGAADQPAWRVRGYGRTSASCGWAGARQGGRAAGPSHRTR